MKKAIGKRLLALLLVVLMLCPQTYASVANDLNGHWCRTEIETFLNKGLVQGYPDGRFRPDATVTRAEFIRMVNSAEACRSSRCERSSRRSGRRSDR